MVVVVGVVGVEEEEKGVGVGGELLKFIVITRVG